MSNNVKRDREIEQRLTSVEVKLQEITENHLPHLDRKISGLEQKIDEKVEKIFDRFSKQDWFLISVMAGLLTSLVIQLVK